MHGAGDVRIEEVPDAWVVEPTDAVIRVTRACHEGLHSACVRGGFFGSPEVGGAQAEAVRVPQADGTLFALPADADEALMPSLLTLSDVLGTGHHAAVVARAGPAKKVAVVGDGAVGICGVIAAKRLGAEQIVIDRRRPRAGARLHRGAAARHPRRSGGAEGDGAALTRGRAHARITSTSSNEEKSESWVRTAAPWRIAVAAIQVS